MMKIIKIRLRNLDNLHLSHFDSICLLFVTWFTLYNENSQFFFNE